MLNALFRLITLKWELYYILAFSEQIYFRVR